MYSVASLIPVGCLPTLSFGAQKFSAFMQLNLPVFTFAACRDGGWIWVKRWVLCTGHTAVGVTAGQGSGGRGAASRGLLPWGWDGF